jgi:putative FmdB family regulatory protein
MPVYEYRCGACAVELEVIVLPSEQAPTTCGECGGELKRLWSRVGVQFVGWGFSRNDAMLPDSAGRKSFKKIKDKASELFD